MTHLIATLFCMLILPCTTTPPAGPKGTYPSKIFLHPGGVITTETLPAISDLDQSDHAFPASVPVFTFTQDGIISKGVLILDSTEPNNPAVYPYQVLVELDGSWSISKAEVYSFHGRLIDPKPRLIFKTHLPVMFISNTTLLPFRQHEDAAAQFVSNQSAPTIQVVYDNNNNEPAGVNSAEVLGAITKAVDAWKNILTRENGYALIIAFEWAALAEPDTAAEAIVGSAPISWLGFRNSFTALYDENNDDQDGFETSVLNQLPIASSIPIAIAANPSDSATHVAFTKPIG